MQDDVAEDDLCGAKPGRALGVNPEWHQELIPGLVSIPEVQPGDTVWWRTDIYHAVGDEHTGDESASVINIGSAPDFLHQVNLLRWLRPLQDVSSNRRRQKGHAFRPADARDVRGIECRA